MANQKKSHPKINDSELPLFLTLEDTDAHLDKPIDVQVTGSIPSWLKGSLYRNGSGLYKIGGERWKHLFDGFAVIVRWTIQDGTVTFLSAILDTDLYQKCSKFGKLAGNNFASNFPDPCKSIFKKFFSHFVPMPPTQLDNPSIHIVELGERLFALTESTVIYEVEPESMQKKDREDLSQSLPIAVGTAHPLVDRDGSTVYYGLNPKAISKVYTFMRVPPQPEGGSPFAGAKVIATAPSRHKMRFGYTHSFGMTENYLVHFELPLCLDLAKSLTIGVAGSSLAECIINHPSEKINIIVIDKSTGKRIPIKYSAPHGHCFHFANCYEESGHVICDVCLYDKGDLIRDFYLENFTSRGDTREFAGSHFTRFVLPLSLDGAEAGKNLVTLPDTQATALLREGSRDTLDVTFDRMFGDSRVFELPRINDSYTGQKYRYVYGSTVFCKKQRTLTKLDLIEKTAKDWSCDEHHLPGEPVFVPRPGAAEEDDGVVLTQIVSCTKDHPSFLLVLDAASFQELGRAVMPPDVPVSYTFHGGFTKKVFSNI